MSTLRYTNYTNLDARFARPYVRGDRLVKGWEGEVDSEEGDPLNGAHRILDWLFYLHNRDDRPDGQLCPSMSVGDVVVLGETTWSVASLGFVPVVLDPADLITDGTWIEMTR